MFIRGLGLMTMLLGLLCMGCSLLQSQRIDSGIEGEMIRSPTCGGPVREGQVCEAPLQTTFSVYDADMKLVTTFKTDEEGQFKVALTPGTYTLVADAKAPIMRPESQPQTVTVEADAYTNVRLVFDTGML